MSIGYSFRQLEYFIAIAETNSVAGAAARLNVSQPSISAALTKLEQQIGLQLFIRVHAQGMLLTANGSRLLQEARNILHQASEWQQQAKLAGSQVAGTLRLGAFATLAPAYLPGVIAGFRQRYPRSTIDLVEGAQDELLRGLRSGHQELALIYDVDLPDDIDTITLASSDPYVLLHEAHPLAHQHQVSLRQLAGEPMILLDVVPSSTYFLGLLRAQGIEPQIAFSSPSLELVRGLVGRGLGFSLLVTKPISDITYEGRPLVTRPIAEAVEPGIVALGKLKVMRPTSLVNAFIDYCSENPPAFMGLSKA